MSQVKKSVISSSIAIALLSASSLSAKPIEQTRPIADVGVINKERIVYWLKKRGEIKQDATQQEIDTKLKAYIRGASGYVEPDSLKKSREMAVKKSSQFEKKSSKTSLVPKTVKVLAVMIDFPDLRYSAHGLTANDTDMYYASYPVSHYQDMMFSTSGFEGPSGQNLISGYQYYQEESGGEFFFTGSAYGWVTADNNAAEYGGHEVDPQSGRDNNDKDTESLVKEAVAKAVAANSIDLSEFDIEDPYDIDEDGNLNEPDGFIDHVMIFHSSIGEEAGGGDLGEDAIWSHRFYVDPQGTEGDDIGYKIPGTDFSVFGYTVQPIDAAAGVIVHEFGHDLGLPDEYDTGELVNDSPVGFWSIMSYGSWAGELAGSKPTGFSSYTKSYLQETHGANWINETVLDFESMSATQDIQIVDATNHENLLPNVVRINLPRPLESFKAPFAGAYQYYSGSGDNLANEMTFDISVPDSDNAQLSMKAHWEIEEDWDFVQVLINDTAIAGNHTRATNPYTGQYTGYDDAVNYITENSSSIAGATGDDSWVDLTFDISAYKGQSVTVKFLYSTDTNTGGYGFVADEIVVSDGSNSTYSDGAEVAGAVTEAGFARIDNSRLGSEQNYWVQLRSHQGNDQGLSEEGYDHGVAIWFSDTEFGTNRSSIHPGRGFNSIVDADQNLIVGQETAVQIHDAAFSQFEQAAYGGDNNRDAIPVFDDSLDYHAPNQPESGVVLPNLGLNIELVTQATDSTSATIRISKQATVATARFRHDVNGSKVTFRNRSTGPNGLTYAWNFGDGSAGSTDYAPVHAYSAEGIFNVTLTVTDSVSGATDSFSETVEVGSAPVSSFTFNADGLSVNFTNTTTGGIGTLRYEWSFGDNNSSTESSPTHTYSQAGTFTVILTVTDGANVAHSSSQEVTVEEPSSGGGNGGNGGGTGGGSGGGSSSGGGAALWGLALLPLLLRRRKR